MLRRVVTLLLLLALACALEPEKTAMEGLEAAAEAAEDAQKMDGYVLQQNQEVDYNPHHHGSDESQQQQQDENHHQGRA